MSTSAQIEANRQNAALSTGPLSPETKAISSMNALKTGLTGRTILLPGDDIDAYNALIARLERKYQPEGEEEKVIVQTIVDTEWRLARIPVLESGIYAHGRIKFADFYPDAPDRMRVLDAHTQDVHRNELKNLHLQETRLQRRLKNEEERLDTLQKIRNAPLRHRHDVVYEQYKYCRNVRKPFDLERFGSEFALPYLAARYEYAICNGEHKLWLFDASWRLQGKNFTDPDAKI